MPHIKFLHTADLHLSRPFGFLPPEQARERRADQRKTFAKILDTAIERHINIALFSGDIFDNADPDPTDLETVTQGLYRLSENNIHTFVIPGNHDYIYPNSIWHKIQAENLHIFTKTEWESINLDDLGISVYGIAFDRNKSEKRAFDGLEIDQGIKSIVMAHASHESFGAVLDRYHPFSTDELLKLNATYTALGHYHSLNMPMNNDHQISASYPGTPEGISFDASETGNRYIIFGEIGDEIGISIEHIPINIKTMKSVEIDCITYQTEASLIDAVRSICEKNALIEIKLNGIISPELMPVISAIPDRFKESCQFMCLKTSLLSIQTDISDDDMTIKGRFYKYLKDQIDQSTDIETTRRLQKALEIGLSALDGRRI